jgi:hypothetical protein
MKIQAQECLFMLPKFLFPSISTFVSGFRCGPNLFGRNRTFGTGSGSGGYKN